MTEAAQQAIMNGLIEEIRQQISGLTPEDFDCDETFQNIWNYRSMPVLFERAKDMLRTRAKQLGMRTQTFDSLWKAFEKERKQAERQMQEMNHTEFTGQPLELKCGRYICNDNGIFKTEPDRFGDIEICVCSHPIMPSKRLINIETGEVQWELAYRRGGMWHYETVDKQAVADKASVIKALGRFDISINSGNAQPFVQYLNDIMEYNRDIIPEEKSISRLGWVDGYGFSPYVSDLHYDSYGKYREEFAAIQQAGSWEKWRDMYKAVRASGLMATRLAFAAAAISPFVSKLNSLPFFYHIWGSQSSIGKTVALMAATSVWAKPEVGVFAKTCQSTDVAFEQMAAFCNNLPLFLDELQLLRDRNRNFDKIIYSLCEGVEKIRGAKEGGIRQTRRWCNVMISTGESPITSMSKGAGAIARVIEAECQSKLFDDPIAVASLVRENYGWAGKMIIDALSDPNSGLTMERIKAWREEFYEQFDTKDKQAMAMSLLMTGDAIMGELLDEPEFTNLSLSQVSGFIRSQDEMNVGLSCYNYLCEWITGNAWRFESSIAGKDDTTFERYGCRDAKNPNLVYVINRYMTDIIKTEGYDPKAFLSWAKANHLLKVNGDKSHPYGYRKRMPFNGGGNVWTIALLTDQSKIPRDDKPIDTEEDD